MPLHHDSLTTSAPGLVALPMLAIGASLIPWSRIGLSSTQPTFRTLAIRTTSRNGRVMWRQRGSWVSAGSRQSLEATARIVVSKRGSPVLSLKSIIRALRESPLLLGVSG